MLVYNNSLSVGIHGVCVNSSIVDEGVLVKKVMYKVEGEFIPTRLHYIVYQ